MKKIVTLLSLSAITAISSFAGLSQTNIDAIDEFIWKEVDKSQDQSQTYNELLNVLNQKYFIKNKPKIVFNEIFFSEKTNSIITSRTIKEKDGIVEMKNERFSFDKNDWPEYTVFNEKNRDALRNTLMYFSCKDLNAFGNTNFVEVFNGTFNGKFAVTYTINQKTCDEVYKKASNFEQIIMNYEKSKANEGIKIQPIGFFAFEEKFNQYSKSFQFVKIHVAPNDNQTFKVNEPQVVKGNDTKVVKPITNNNPSSKEVLDKRKLELIQAIDKLKKQENQYSKDIQNLKLELDRKTQIKDKKIGTKEFQLKIEKDIYNIKEKINIKTSEQKRIFDNIDSLNKKLESLNNQR